MDLFTIKDIQHEIMLYLGYKDVVSFSRINTQMYSCDTLWQTILIRDYPFLYPQENTKRLYESYFKFFNKWTLRIIGKFITYTTKYVNMDTIYHKVNIVLVKYVDQHCKLEEMEDINTKMREIDTLLLNIIYELFDALEITLYRHFTIDLLHGLSSRDKSTDVGKICGMKALFEKLHDDFQLCDMEW